MQAVETLPKIIEREENIAYFCTFDDATRLHGTEMLASGNEFIRMRDEDRAFLQTHVFRTIRESGGKISFLPVFAGYDYVSKVFHDLQIRRSQWPSLGIMVPDVVSRGTVEREAENNFSSGQNNTIKPEIASAIPDLRERIRNGELLQCVLSQEFPMKEINVVNTLKRFLKEDRSAYVFYMKFGQFQLLGSSPENLVTMTGRNLRIKPIAGTRIRGRTPEEDLELGESLLNDEKELLEHRMLVDLARNDLGKISMPGSVRVTRSMELQKFATVQHIVSTVESEREERFTEDDVLRAVFPAGTVSGAPKRRAVELIEKYETSPRGPYAGAVGIAGTGYLDLALTIRTLYSSGDGFSVRAGAGIVKDSVVENEAREIVAKARSAAGGAL